jgi:hypothetical protein
MGWDNPGGGGGVALPLSHDDPAQISGVSPDDHHPEVHAVDGADHTGTISDAQHGARGPIVGAHGHDDLDTVTADQHHAQIHAIDSANHTGVLVDAQIPASIARDVELHAQLHSIIGADHSGFPGGGSTFLRDDGVFAAPPGGAGVNKGTAVLNFGAFPGSAEAEVDVAGQAGFVAGSEVFVRVKPVATAGHSVDEHLIENLDVKATWKVDGTFTIKGKVVPFYQHYAQRINREAEIYQDHRLFDTFTVGWIWS